jgi:glycosyltransferase involved in cell wall biosynthesis
MVDKILYVESGTSGGGSAESLFQLLSAMDRTRYCPIVVFTSRTRAADRISSLDVEVLILDDWYLSSSSEKPRSIASWLARALVTHGARLFPRLCLTFDRILTFRARRKIVALLQARSIVLVHTNNNPHRDLWAIEAAARAGVPCVSHLRSFHGLGFSRCRAMLANRYASRFVGYSRSIIEYWADKGVAKEKQRIIHNAIGQLKDSPVDLDVVFGIPAGLPVLGIVGRIIPERGHERLLCAMPMLCKRFPGLKLLVIGDSEATYRQKVTSLAKRLGVSDSITFTGHRRDARGIMAQLTVVVLPYTIEPFGRTLLESWQLGVPVVLSRIGHIADIVTDKEDVLLYDPQIETDLADKIALAISDTALRARLIENGKQTCQARFSIHAQYDLIQRLYRHLLDGAPELLPSP